MTYDEFSEKLRSIKMEFENAKKMEMITIKQLESYLIERKSRSFSRGLKSLKGFKI